MNCFNHQNSAAISICPGCHKGLCQQCCIEQEGVISCNNDDCKNIAITSKKIILNYSIYVRLHDFRYLIFSIIFLFFAYVSYDENFFSIAIGFIVIGLYYSILCLIQFRQK